MDIQRFINTYRVTSFIIGVNLTIFLMNQFSLFPAPLSLPGLLNAGTFLAHFSHYDLLHVLMNMFVFLQISPLLERPLGMVKYSLIIIFIWLATALLIYPVIQHPTLGFSGIMLGILTFTIGYYYHEKQFAYELSGWLMLNILIGLMPQISFWGHLGGAVSGALVFGVFWLFQDKKHLG